MSSFKGQYKYTLDSKGRLNIPSKLRKSISPEANETFVITRGLETCLFVYPLDEWNRIEEKLRNLPMTQKNNRLFVRLMLSNASESQLDKQGRISIPANLLNIARIEKDVLIIGTLERIEFWNPDIFQKYIDEAGESYENIAENIMF